MCFNVNSKNTVSLILLYLRLKKLSKESLKPIRGNFGQTKGKKNILFRGDIGAQFRPQNWPRDGPECKYCRAQWLKS